MGLTHILSRDYETLDIAEQVHTGVEQQFPDAKHIMIHVNPAQN